MASNYTRKVSRAELTENLTENRDVLIYDGYSLCLTPTSTALRNTIQPLQKGLIVYNEDTNGFEYYDGATWLPFAIGSSISALLTASNGLSVDGTDVKLGGDLIENTLIGGAFQLSLGESGNPLTFLSSETTDGMLLASVVPGFFAGLQFEPTIFNLTHSAGVATTALRFENGNGEGIIIRDEIDNVGLRGAVSFNPTNPRDYVQRHYVDATVINVIIPQGNWNSLTNTPTLISSTSPGGNYLYTVSVASSGVTNLDGETVFNVGDVVWFSVATNTWNRIASSFAVQDLQSVTDIGNTTDKNIIVTLGGADISTLSETSLTITNGDDSVVVEKSAVTVDNGAGSIANLNASGITTLSPTNRSDFSNTDYQFLDTVTGNYINTRVPVTISESSDLLLPIGNVDKCFVTSVNGLYANERGEISNDASALVMEDDFLKRLTGSSLIGELNWYLSTLTASLINSELNRPGIMRFTVGSVSNGAGILSLNTTPALGIAAYGNIGEVSFISRINSALANHLFFVGLSQNWTITPQNNAVFRKQATVGATWQCDVRVGGVLTTANSGVVATNNWTKFKIVTNPTSVLFYINDALVATINTAPAANILMLPAYDMINNGALFGNNFDVDYFNMKLKNIVR